MNCELWLKGLGRIQWFVDILFSFPDQRHKVIHQAGLFEPIINECRTFELPFFHWFFLLWTGACNKFSGNNSFAAAGSHNEVAGNIGLAAGESNTVSGNNSAAFGYDERDNEKMGAERDYCEGGW